MFFAACTTDLELKGDTFDQRELLRNSEDVLEEFLAVTEDQVVNRLMGHAKGVVLFPNLVKAAVLAGGRYGNGVAVIRSPKTGKWGRPLFIKSLQASWGLQAGIQKANLMLIVVSRKGVRKLFKTQYSLDSGPEVALGPVGKSIGINIQKLLNKKDIYAYASIKGLYAGFSLKGTIIKVDNDANELFYGKPISQRAVLLSRNVKVPKAGKRFMKNFNKLAPWVKTEKPG